MSTLIPDQKKLATFIDMNVQRNDLVFMHPGADPAYRGLCIAEEAGEVVGVIKKIIRGFNARELKKMKKAWEKEQSGKPGGLDMNKMPSEDEFKILWEIKMNKKLGDEMADLNTYLHLAASKMGIPLWPRTFEKFNEVSKDMDAPEYTIS